MASNRDSLAWVIGLLVVSSFMKAGKSSKRPALQLPPEDPEDNLGVHPLPPNPLKQ